MILDLFVEGVELKHLDISKGFNTHVIVFSATEQKMYMRVYNPKYS